MPTGRHDGLGRGSPPGPGIPRSGAPLAPSPTGAMRREGGGYPPGAYNSRPVTGPHAYTDGGRSYDHNGDSPPQGPLATGPPGAPGM